MSVCLKELGQIDCSGCPIKREAWSEPVTTIDRKSAYRHVRTGVDPNLLLAVLAKCPPAQKMDVIPKSKLEINGGF